MRITIYRLSASLPALSAIRFLPSRLSSWTAKPQCKNTVSLIFCLTLTFTALITCRATLFAAGLANSCWPMFRQNLHHTGASTIPVSGSAGILKWTFPAGNSFDSSPAIGPDGIVYAGSLDGNIYAMNSDGSQKWAFPTGASIKSAPAIGSDGTVYAGSGDGNLYAINADGSQKWACPTGGGVESSPAIGPDGTIYVGSDDNYLYAIDPSTGGVKWVSKTYNHSSSPAIGSDGTVYVGGEDNNLYAINPSTGGIKWVFPTTSWVDSSPSIGQDGTVYVGNDDYYLYAINPDGSQKWVFTTGDAVYSSPAVGSDGTVYVGSKDNSIYAIKSDGSQKWSFTTGVGVESSPAIGADGTVYAGSDDNSIYAVNPDGSQKWAYATNASVVSSPAIGPDGTVYVGSEDNNLYAIMLAPSVTSITPNSAANTGPVSITNLAGAGFVSGTTVKLSNGGQSINAANVTVASSNTITCTFDLTGTTTGTWDVVVTTGGPGSNGALSGGFQITPMLINSITPNNGSNSGPVNITNLSGNGFVAGSTVKLLKSGQSINAVNVNVLNTASITCTFDLTGQTAGYWDVVVSTVGAGSLSAALPAGFQITSANSATSVVNPSNNAELIIYTPIGEAKVNIPAGTFGQTVSVTLSTGPVPSSDKPTIKVGNTCIEITNSLNLQPNQNITITIYYNPSVIAGLGLVESKLAICRYDASHDLWTPIPSTIDKANHVITATVNHFSTFVLVQLAAAADLGGVKVYPNPLNPRTAPAGMTIANLTASATIKIFNVSGELVRTLGYTTANGQTMWDGKNDSGSPVASGVYILYINTPEGTKKIKVAVEK